MKEIFGAIFKFLKNRFNFSDEKAYENQISDNIKRDVNFKGANLWTLIFANMIASTGPYFAGLVIYSPCITTGANSRSVFPNIYTVL